MNIYLCKQSRKASERMNERESNFGYSYVLYSLQGLDIQNEI